MGLAAQVFCKCISRGAVHIPEEFAPYIVIDPFESSLVDLNLDYKGNEKLFQRFDTWSQDACEHKDFAYFSAGIANWGGVSVFQDMLVQLDEVAYKPVIDCLPNGNGGFMTTEQAAEVLDCLMKNDFTSQKLENLGLFDKENDTLIAEYISAYGGVFEYIGPEYKMGLNEKGLFISESGKMVFSALSFRQELVINKSLLPRLFLLIKMYLFKKRKFNENEANLKFTDLESGKEYISSIDLRIAYEKQDPDSGQLIYVVPEKLEVKIFQKDMENYCYEAYNNLIKLCEASVEIGNPVIWC